jgi:predicted PurR-regulated permease PerM
MRGAPSVASIPGAMGGWIKATAVVTLTALAVAAVVWAVRRALVAVALTAVALLLAVALDRPVRWLQAHGAPRGVAIAAVMLGVVGVLAALVLLFVPPAVAQVQALVGSAPELLRRLEQSAAYRWADRHVDLGAALDQLRRRSPDVASEVVGKAVTVVSVVAGAVAALVTVLFVVVFMLASGPRLLASAMGRVRPERRAIYGEVLAALYRSLGAYVAGLLVLVLSNAVFSGAFLALVGVGYFLPLAVLAGLSSLIPYAGAILAGAMLSIVAWGAGGPWLALATLGYFVVYQQVEDHVIAPLVYRRALDLNPLVVLLAALFMTALAGIPGAVVAVPLAATVQIVAREAFRLRA